MSEEVFDGRDPTVEWWEETDPNKAGKLMLSAADSLHEAQSARRRRNLRHARLYANQDLRSIYDCGVTGDDGAGVYLSVNVTESCISTLAAKMLRTRIRPSLQTEKGSRSLQRAAEQGTHFIDGVFHRSELHEGEGEQIFVDGGIFGTGWAYTQGTPDREIVTERCLPDEMSAPSGEAKHGKRSLMTLYRRKYIHRQVLYRMADATGKPFGDDKEKRAAIRNADGSSMPGTDLYEGDGHMIPVRFGWRLPSKKGATDGGYVVAIDGATLFSKRWKRTRFPFDMFQFARRIVGIWGKGLAEQLVPIQLKINEQIERIDEGQRLNCNVRILHKQGAINPDEFDNEIGRLVALAAGYSLDDVKILEGKGASREIYEDLETWIRRAYEVTGVSMLSASAEKPEGISSAVALRELLDREDLRFSALGKRWERFNRDVGETILDTAAEMAADDRPLVVQVPGDKWVKEVDFAALKLDRQKHVVTVAAASSLPTTPAARKQYADDLLERQAITMARYLEIIDESGDVRGVTSMITAVQEAIDLDIEGILDDGKWRAPERLLDPALARDTAIAVYAKARHEDVPDDRMEMLQRYILLATKLAGPVAAAPGVAQDQAAVAEQPAGAAPAPDPMNQGVDAATAAVLAPDIAADAPIPVPPVPPVPVPPAM